MMPTRWNRTPTSAFLKVEPKGASHQLQPWGTPIGSFRGEPYGNLQKSHTNALIQPDEQSTPSSCKHRFSHPPKSPLSKVLFYLGCPRSFVDRRMGRCEMDGLDMLYPRNPHSLFTTPQWHRPLYPLRCRNNFVVYSLVSSLGYEATSPRPAFAVAVWGEARGWRTSSTAGGGKGRRKSIRAPELVCILESHYTFPDSLLLDGPVPNWLLAKGSQ